MHKHTCIYYIHSYWFYEVMPLYIFPLIIYVFLNNTYMYTSAHLRNMSSSFPEAQSLSFRLHNILRDSGES